MAEKKPFAPHLFGPGHVPEGVLPYPTQSKKKPTETNFAGELRGYYGPPQFSPRKSRFGLVRTHGNGTPKAHAGVDIYAPYAPFPHETPIYAICSGKLSFHYDNEAPNDIGNRAWLRPDDSPKDRVIFGHLNRFVGHDRWVCKDELIGFAGCSGNADGDRECTTIGQLNINSGHVHVAYLPPEPSAPVDPLAKLGWTLRFADVDDAIPLKTWTDDGQLLDRPAPPDFALGILRTGKPSGIKSVGKATDPSRLETPFETIDFDNKAAIRVTAEFYRLAYERLAQDEAEQANATFRKHGIAAFRGSIAAARILLQRLSDIIAELDEIAHAPDTPETLPVRIRRAQTRTVEFLFDGLRLLSLAMAGEALLPVTRNPGTVYDPVRKKSSPVPGVPRSGIGLSGRSILVALGNGRAALQASFLKTLADDAANHGKKRVVPYSGWTLSVSFGAGTPWHTILDEKFAGEAGKHPAATAQMLKDYLTAVYNCTFMLSALARIVCSNSKVVDSAGLKRYLASVKAAMGAVAGEAEEPGEARKLIAVLAAIGGKDATIHSLLSTLAKTSADAATQATACFDPKLKQLERIRSAYDMIWIDPSG